MLRRSLNNKKIPSSTVLLFSMFKRNIFYTGPCMEIRNESNDTLEIYFKGNFVDVKSILDFCAGGNGFIVKWYSQDKYDTNQIIAQQDISASQPQIVSNGTFLYYLLFDGIDDYMLINKESKIDITNLRISIYYHGKHGSDSGYILCSNYDTIYNLQYALYKQNTEMGIRFDWESTYSGRFLATAGTVQNDFNKYLGVLDNNYVKSSIDNAKPVVYTGDVYNMENTYGKSVLLGARNDVDDTFSIFVENQLKEIAIFNNVIEWGDLVGIFDI